MVLLTPPNEVMFSLLLVCLSVCLLVCQSVCLQDYFEYSSVDFHETRWQVGHGPSRDESIRFRGRLVPRERKTEATHYVCPSSTNFHVTTDVSLRQLLNYFLRFYFF